MDIKVSDISKIYGTGESRVVALDHADMTIHGGDFISIMGPSGFTSSPGSRRHRFTEMTACMMWGTY